jgi:hypothetical protein
LSSKHAVSFFVRLCHFVQNVKLELQNEETSEKLEIKLDENEVLISRHSIGENEEWIREMNKQPNYEYRNIIIS